MKTIIELIGRSRRTILTTTTHKNTVKKTVFFPDGTTAKRIYKLNNLAL